MLRSILTLGECQSQMDLDSQYISLALRDEYRLFAPKPSEVIAPDVQRWVHKYPLAWAEMAGMGLAKQRHPVIIELKAEAIPVRVRQYPMSQEARRGITPHI